MSSDSSQARSDAVTGNAELGFRRTGFASLVDGRVAVLVIGGLLAILVLPPLLFLLQSSVGSTARDGPSRLSLEHFAALFAQRGFVASMANSLVFATGSAVAALLIGGVNAWIAERTNAPFRALAYLTTIISLGTPYVLYVGAWLLLLNRSGPLNSLWRDLTGETS